MTVAHDVYSETNPAYGTYALEAFTTAYLSINDRGPELALAYLALPLALSGDLGSTFLSTNRNTGLSVWVERHPRIQIGLSSRLEATMPIVSDAFRLACFAHVLNLKEDGRLGRGPAKINKSAAKSLQHDAANSIKHSERLGYWFAMKGSARAVFDVLGVTV